MSAEPRDGLEKVLAALPYPGEEEAAVRSRLERARLPERVMEGVMVGSGEGEAPAPRRRRPLAWAAFALLDLALLAGLGADRSFLPEYFGARRDLAGFFFLFLGLALLGGVSGLVLTLDTSRLRRLLGRGAYSGS